MLRLGSAGGARVSRVFRRQPLASHIGNVTGNGGVAGLSAGWKRRLGQSAATNAAPTATTSYPLLTMFLIGCTGGAFGSIMGLGGGVVLVPLLTALARMPQKNAIGTSLVTAIVIGGVGAANYAREGLVDIVNAAVVAVGSSMTATFGAKFAQSLSDKKLKVTLGIYMLIMAGVVPARDIILKSKWRSKQEAPNQENNNTTEDVAISNGSNDLVNEVLVHGVFLGTGWLAGFASGMFGIAGGTIVTPMLAIWSDLTQPQVVGTSLTAGLVPSILAARSFYKGGHVALSAVPAISAGASLGALVGSSLALLLTDDQLRAVFGGGMFMLGLRTLIKAR